MVYLFLFASKVRKEVKMLTVTDLMALPLFSEFELVSDTGGLHNSVSGTGIFEWETPEIIKKTFDTGEFVITTLNSFQDYPENAMAGIKALIEIKVSAICVKKVYMDHVPDEIIEYANKYNVPVFAFSHTYFDDIIYTIKSLLASGNHQKFMVDKIKELLKCTDKHEQLHVSLEINPLFQKNCVCCCCVPRNKAHKKTLNGYMALSPSQERLFASEKEMIYSIIKCNNCIVLIYTEDNNTDDVYSRITNLLSFSGITPAKFRMGFSTQKTISDLKLCIEEAQHAAYYTILYQENHVQYKDIGSWRMIIPLMNTVWADSYLRDMDAKICSYDEEHHADLQKTLITYIESDGDINLTAQKLFQHGNTIRYRVDKIKSILEISESNDIFVQFFIYVGLHKLYQLFSGEPLI